MSAASGEGDRLTPSGSESASASIAGRARAIANEAAARTGRPALGSDAPADGSADDLAFLATTLAAAIAVGASCVFTEHVRWLRDLVSDRGLPASRVEEALTALAAAVGVCAPRAAPAAAPLLDEALEALRVQPRQDPPPPMSEPAQRLVSALLAGDEDRAYAEMMFSAGSHELVAQGLEGVVRPALTEVGRRWQTGAITVADEHRATGLVARLAPRVLVFAPPMGLTAAFACIEPEQHDVGATLVGQALRQRGWCCALLGGSVPADDLVRYVARNLPDVVGLSFTMGGYVSSAPDVIAQLRAAAPGVRILIGGRLLDRCSGLAGVLGAEAAGGVADAAAWADGVAASRR